MQWNPNGHRKLQDNDNGRQSPICDNINVTKPLLLAKGEKESSVQYFIKVAWFEVVLFHFLIESERYVAAATGV